MLYDIIWQVLVVLTSAVLLGEVFAQFGLPSVAGELLSGLLIGPTVFGIIVSDSQIQAISAIVSFLHNLFDRPRNENGDGKEVPVESLPSFNHKFHSSTFDCLRAFSLSNSALESSPFYSCPGHSSPLHFDHFCHGVQSGYAKDRGRANHSILSRSDRHRCVHPSCRTLKIV